MCTLFIYDVYRNTHTYNIFLYLQVYTFIYLYYVNIYYVKTQLKSFFLDLLFSK